MPVNLTLANRVGVALPETPPAVQTAIHNRIPDAPIDGIQRGIWNGQNIYEVTYHDTGKRPPAPQTAPQAVVDVHLPEPVGGAK